MMTSISETIDLYRSPELVLIMDTPKGRGVFAKNKILAGQLIETCPVLVIPKEDDEKHIKHTVLYHYTYNWPVTDETGRSVTTQAIIFGLGSMFNHSINQNVGWERDVKNLLVRYKALRDIDKGEELCISYGSRLTFKDADVHEQDDEEEFPQLNRMMIDS